MKLIISIFQERPIEDLKILMIANMS